MLNEMLGWMLGWMLSGMLNGMLNGMFKRLNSALSSTAKVFAWMVLCMSVFHSAAFAEETLDDEESAPVLTRRAGQVDSNAQRSDSSELEGQLRQVTTRLSVTESEIKRIKDVEFLPELYMSLADLHLQRARMMYLIKVSRNKNTPISELDFTAEKRPKLEAIEIYQKVYAFFPKSKLRDRAVFFKALEQRDLGQAEAMLKTLGQLNQEFPNSIHVREANIIVGDYFLEEKKDLEGAIEAFQRVTSKELSPFTPLAHYRIGWVHINNQKYDEAIRAFEEAIRTQGLVSKDLLPESYRKTDIRREAVLSMAVPYVETYGDYRATLKDGDSAILKSAKSVEHPIDYFRRTADSHLTYRRVLSRVGRRLALKELWGEAADIWLEVLKASTDPQVRFEAAERWNDAFKKAASPAVSKSRFTTSADRVELVRHVVMTAQGIRSQSRRADKKLGRKELNQLKFLEVLARDVSTRLHAEARSTKSKSDYEMAVKCYELYQIGFPQNRELAKMLVNRAESLFKAGLWTRAGMDYELLAANPPKGTSSAEFRESAVEAYVNALKDADQLSVLDRLRSRQGLRQVGQVWLKTKMRHPAAATTAYNIAQSWYEDRNLKEAIQSFRYFISKFPQDERVRDAIFLVINSYSQLDDLTGLATTAKQLERTPGLKDADRQAIRDAARRAQLKEIQAAAGEFGSKSYAENLVNLAANYKDSSMGAAAFFEAFVSLRSKRDPEMFDVGEGLIEKFSDSSFAKEAVSSMAQTALMTSDFERAARYLGRYAEKYPNEKESKEWRRSSAQISEWLGDFKNSRKFYVAMGDREAVVRVDLLAGDWRSLAASAGPLGGDRGTYLKSIAQWRQGQQAEALNGFRTTSRSSTAEIAAHSRFLIAQRSLEEFRGIKMRDAQDQASLVAKVKSFQELAKELNDIVKLGAGRWTIASLYLLGQANFELGRFIASSPLPQGLKPAELEAYRGELSKQGQQYKVAAQQVFKQCLETAEKFEILTRYVQGCRAEGQAVISESADLIQSGPPKFRAPASARALRAKLYDQPRDLNTLHALAEAYMADGQYWFAIAIWNRMLEIQEGHARAMAGIGVARLFLNDLDAGTDWLKKALKANANEPTAVWNLAQVYQEFGFKTRVQQLNSRKSKLPRPKFLATLRR